MADHELKMSKFPFAELLLVSLNAEVARVIHNQVFQNFCLTTHTSKLAGLQSSIMILFSHCYPKKTIVLILPVGLRDNH